MLVDNTIVMLENISRHQQKGESMLEAGVNAAREVNSAIVAATSTNLAAVLPFLFVGGLVGLLFRELIFTISAAIVASMIIALTLVPALASRVKGNGGHGPQAWINQLMGKLQTVYQGWVDKVLRHPLPVILVFLLLLTLPAWFFNQSKPEFLPKMDDGRISINIRADAGISLDTMDKQVRRIEEIINAQPGVDRVFTISGGRIFGRTEREIPNYSTLTVQLVPRSQRDFSNGEWVSMLRKATAKAQLVGIKIKPRTGSIRGIRISQGDDDISLRIQGPELKQLETMADALLPRLRKVAGLRNLEHSSEEKRQELAISIDRERAAALGLDVEDLGRAMRIALQGVVVTDYLEGDRAYDVRLRLPQEQLSDPQSMESVLLFPARDDRPAIYLGNVADVNLVESPADINRDNQQRIIEISGSVAENFTIGEVMAGIDEVLADFSMPEGYSIYDGGVKKAMQEGRELTHILLFLAIFLVFVVMAVQYESLRNPLVIIIGVPFASVGVVVGLLLAGLPVSTPVWLGMIMLAGIVVNNAIVMVEYIEILRERGQEIMAAVREAAGLRLRPILMTTLTTVAGMMPLALGLGEGAEMLQPLAVVIVYGLSFSMLVSLLLIPALYRLFHQRS
jgi:multidrug efflux pump subunit AcrB